MAEKLFENQSDEDIVGLGREVERFIREDANLTTAWVRTESHFGAGKFSLLRELFAKPKISNVKDQNAPNGQLILYF